MRRVSAAFVALVLALHWAPASPLRAPAARAEDLESQVNRAIAKGISRLRAWQNPDGSYPIDGWWSADADGATALAAYSLMKSEVSPGDPAVARALSWLRGKPVVRTYGAATRILALDATKDPSHEAEIRRLGLWIDDAMNRKDGLWGYPEGPTDLSNTQFAILGLWTAGRHGWKANPTLWNRILQRVPDHQTPGGGFFYSTARGVSPSTGSLTVAGILALTLGLEAVAGTDASTPETAARARASLARAWEHMDRRFRADANPLGDYALTRDWHLYYLYGTERAAALGGRKEIAGKDWYREGAQVLLNRQAADGSWGAVPDTCFALLFLRKATATLLGKDASIEGEALELETPTRIQAPSAEAPYVRNWLVLGPLPNADDSRLERPLAPGEELPGEAVLAAPGTGKESIASEAGTWVLHSTGGNWIDLAAAAGPGAPRVYHAQCWLHAAKDTTVVFWTGHDDGAKVLLDGKVVHDCHYHEAVGADAHREKVTLAKGIHRLLFRVEDLGGSTGFSLRFAHVDGSPAPEVVANLAGR